MRWEPGRQGTGYEKLRLFVSRWLKCDLWLLRFREGAYIGRHTDPVPGYRHYRVNVIVKAAGKGGQFISDAPIVDWRRLKIFRSDAAHMVTRVEHGTRYVLSFGFLRSDG